jgi:hypothetical protein
LPLALGSGTNGASLVSSLFAGTAPETQVDIRNEGESTSSEGRANRYADEGHVLGKEESARGQLAAQVPSPLIDKLQSGPQQRHRILRKGTRTGLMTQRNEPQRPEQASRTKDPLTTTGRQHTRNAQNERQT